MAIQSRRADDTATGLKPSAMIEGRCPEHAPETGRDGARTRFHLIESGDAGLYHDTAGARTRDRTAASRIRQAASRRHRRGERERGCHSPEFLGLSATCVRIRRLRRINSIHSIPMGCRPTLPGSAHLARLAPCCGTRSPRGRRDLPVRTMQPSGMESLPADMGERSSPDNPLRDTVTADDPSASQACLKSVIR